MDMFERQNAEYIDNAREARDKAKNNLIKSRSKWESERALHDKLDRIEEMLNKLLNEKV